MSSNISGISNPQTIEQNTTIKSNQTVKQNETAATLISDTNTSSPNLTNAHNAKLHHIEKALINTYRLDSTDVEDIKAFIKALEGQIDKQIERQTDSKDCKDLVCDLKSEAKASKNLKDEIDSSMNVKSGFFTKLKSLCARIASFFGDNSKIEKLQSEGLSQFSNLKGILTQTRQGQDFLKSFIEKNCNNQEAMAGMFKSLFGISINKNSKDVEQNVTGLKEILGSDNSEEILGLIDESKTLKIDKLSIKTQQILCAELDKLTIDSCKDDSITKNIKSLLRATNFFIYNNSGIDNKKAIFYNQNLAQLAGRVSTFLKDFKELDGNKLHAKFNEFKTTINNTKIKYKLMDYIKDGKKLSPTLTIDDLIGAARESLGDKKFLLKFKSEISDGSLKIQDEKFLSNFKSEILDGSWTIKDKDLLAKLQIDLTNKKELKEVAQAFLWADKETIQESLSETLTKPDNNIKTSEDLSTSALENSTIYKDVKRGYSYTFHIGGSKIELNRENFSNFEKNLQELSDEDKNKLTEFIINFSSQGCFAIQQQIAGNGQPSFVVNFDPQSNDTKIQVTTNGENSNFGNFGAFIDQHDQNLFTTLFEEFKSSMSMSTNCQFSFTYTGGIVACKGSASNISVQNYEQNIIFAE